MFTVSAATPALRPPGDAGRVGLRIEAVRPRLLGPGAPYVAEEVDERLKRYLTDLARIYDVPMRPGFLRTATRNTFADMAEQVVADLSPFDGPVDMVMVAHATPDADLRRSATSYLTLALPGDPLPGGVSDHGVVAPFMALRLIGEYVRAHGFRRVVLVVFDQSSRPFEMDIDRDVRPVRDAAVGIVLTPAGERGDPRVHQFAAVEPGDVNAALTSVIGGGDAVAASTLIAGRGLDPSGHVPAGFGRVVRAPIGFPCTGLWSQLAEESAGGPGRRIVLADYDRNLRQLAACVIDFPVIGPEEPT